MVSRCKIIYQKSFYENKSFFWHKLKKEEYAKKRQNIQKLKTKHIENKRKKEQTRE